MNKEERLRAAEAYAANIDKYSYLDKYAFTNREVNQIAQDAAHLGFEAGAEAEAESKWVSVDERLPEQLQDVVCICKNGLILICTFFKCFQPLLSTIDVPETNPITH